MKDRDPRPISDIQNTSGTAREAAGFAAMIAGATMVAVEVLGKANDLVNNDGVYDESVPVIACAGLIMAAMGERAVSSAWINRRRRTRESVVFINPNSSVNATEE